ncbi:MULTISPECIES: hypothetical protein [Cobetia]|uniref:hypothetical protein n=1 Tax=Cobetia TaxID=204286 RepID=UPI001583DFBF|nr:MULTISPECIES: hypothetical protein [Cobetia]MDI4659565.1 hypothetical protein [Cobetia sp. BMC6]NUJ56113.1 hypothetical protein [Cobetia marina]
MADYPVKWFSNDMGGAPVLGDTSAGDFIALLKACLITGFNVTPVASATYEAESGEVLVTLTTGHGFKAWQVIEVSGADQESYNGQHRVTSIGSDWVRYAPDAAPSVSPATGTTIEIKAAPVGGWQVVAEDAENHRIALTRTDPTATDMTFIIENNGNEGDYPSGGEMVARVRVCEAFTDLDTYEQALEEFWPASHRYANDQTWMLVADARLIFWTPKYGRENKSGTVMLGDIDSVRPGDAYHCVLNGLISGSTAEWDSTAESYYSNMADFEGNTNHQGIARSYYQLPGSAQWTLAGISSGMGGLLDYPNPQTNGFYVSTGRLMVIESGGLRGFMPGLLQPLQTSAVYAKAIIDTLPSLEGVPVLFWLSCSAQHSSSPEVLFAWRLDNWRGESIQ